MKALSTAAILLAAAATPAAAESWTILDGCPGSLKNVWDMTVTDGKITATAGLADRPDAARTGERVVMFGAVVNGDYRITLPDSANGPGCLFVSERDGDNQLVGVATCGASNAIWRARKN